MCQARPHVDPARDGRQEPGPGPEPGELAPHWQAASGPGPFEWPGRRWPGPAVLPPSNAGARAARRAAGGDLSRDDRVKSESRPGCGWRGCTVTANRAVRIAYYK